jgi:tetratricopeptide (TPR) repeat protein
MRPTPSPGSSREPSSPDEAGGLLRELLAQPPAARRRAFEQVRFESPALCRQLLSASEDRIFDLPAESLELARLAQELAERLEASEPPTAPVSVAGELRFLATLQVANALRVTGELTQAEELFHAVRGLLRELGEPPHLEAELLYLEASLHTDQRRFSRALASIDRALERYRNTRRRERRCEALIKKGHILLTWETRVGSALRAFQEAVPLLDPQRQPRLLVICLHNLILGLNRLGYTIAARSLLGEVKDLHLRLGDRANLLKLRWVEGQLDMELGRLDSAERAFAEARDGFVDLELPYQAALVCLDLAEVYLQQSRSYKLRQLAVEMFPIFQSRHLHREALAALIVFREAVAVQGADQELIREIAAFLTQVQRNPKLRFRPSR